MANSIFSESTSSEMMTRAIGGESDAWQQLVDRYGPGVFQIARRSGLDLHDAEELTQEVMFAVYRNIGEIQRHGEGKGFRKWLWRVIENRIRDRRRRSCNEREKFGERLPDIVLHELSADSLTDSEILNHDPAMRAVLIEVIESLRGRVNDTTWLVFWRSVVDNVPHDILADELNISVAQVRTYKSRMLKRIRDQLLELYGPEGMSFPDQDFLAPKV